MNGHKTWDDLLTSTFFLINNIWRISGLFKIWKPHPQITFLSFNFYYFSFYNPFYIFVSSFYTFTPSLLLFLSSTGRNRDNMICGQEWHIFKIKEMQIRIYFLMDLSLWSDFPPPALQSAILQIVTEELADHFYK